MKLISLQKASEKLIRIKTALKTEVTAYERLAKSCLTCETPGTCCVDEHFVNVHISKLEAVAIGRKLRSFPPERRDAIYKRIDTTVEKYGLTTEGDTYARTFACPLFEKEVGCLVHNDGKPVPCIVHACYERRADLPPDELQMRAEQKIDDLNRATYGHRLPPLPLPLALKIYTRPGGEE